MSLKKAKWQLRGSSSFNSRKSSRVKACGCVWVRVSTTGCVWVFACVVECERGRERGAFGRKKLSFGDCIFEWGCWECESSVEEKTSKEKLFFAHSKPTVKEEFCLTFLKGKRKQANVKTVLYNYNLSCGYQNTP